MNILFFLTPKSEVAYIPADESLRQAFEKLKYHGYSAVPTLTDDGKYAGTITEGDVLRAMESMCHWNISEAEKVKLMDVKRKRNIQAVTISTDMDKREFIEFMVESDVLKFGEFTLKSGRKSPFFMNAGAYVTGSQLKRLGEYYAKAIHSTYGDDFDVLFGPAYKGIPLGVVTAIAYSELYGKEVRYCSDRKEAKDHGADKGNFLGSELKDGDRVIMIEDVTTSGKSMEETVPKVKGAANVEIVGLMVSLNRMEIGKGGEKCALDEVKELYGFDTAAIVDMEEVVECLYNKECNGKVVIDDTLKAAIDAYYEQYGAKH